MAHPPTGMRKFRGDLHTLVICFRLRAAQGDPRGGADLGVVGRREFKTCIGRSTCREGEASNTLRFKICRTAHPLRTGARFAAPKHVEKVCA